jgi:acetolactate decarboxylase
MTPSRVFQLGLMSALLAGVYDGPTPLREVLRHGDMGLGTFNGLDGEMILVDGDCFRMRSDGSIDRPSLDECTPFAIVTHFTASASSAIDQPMDRAAVIERVRTMVPSENYLYAVRVTGSFESVVTRTVQRQTPPYRPMREAVGDQIVLEFRSLAGTIAGFRTPLYERGIGVPGGHVHFIDDERRRGGHVLDFRMLSGTVEVCVATELDLRLPLDDGFRDANLEPQDLAAQLTATEGSTH